MSRPIKFRGKELGSEEWAHGYYIVQPMSNGENGHYIFDGEYEVRVDPETVGQYTGLQDRNGKEIYGGDIIQFEDVDEDGYEYKEGYDFTNRATVTFEDGRITLDEFMDTNSGVVEELNDHEETWSVIQNSEVIGNRWDHPHLLKGDDTDATT